jgi:hypothetical protein
MAIQSTAESLFQTAYERRYTWDENFPGYSAYVQLLQEGEIYTGKIQIDPRLNIRVTEVADTGSSYPLSKNQFSRFLWST